MRKSKTRRRVAVKTAAGVVGAGIIFGAIPAIASLAAVPKAVTYTCTLVTGGTVPQNSYKLQMDLAGPIATPTPNSTVVVTWRIGQPAASPSLVAPAAIAAGDRLEVDADVVITGSPLPSPMETRSVGATSTPGAVASGAAIPGFPTVLVTVLPTATGVIAVQPDAFTLVHSLAAGGTGAGTDLYDCVPVAAEAAAAAALVTVKPTGTATTTPPVGATTTPPVTPSSTPPTVEPIVTVTRTKTSQPVSTRQIEKTPDGAAATGGGGDAGPDARLIMFGGALMVAFAGIGGLVLRRRTATRG